ncbi:hypothetical protein KIN20_031623 [Parelaphostrongylus tenuis]|uniref:Uncharacterized protein n=1 Tax=Parelaphostrongylus tenuis TaxID=148309 RepID=A0AAD5WHE0_PARTN|nr:hypothetical protein KIN20_031623 [Parelaphostrongylus tenuis]
MTRSRVQIGGIGGVVIVGVPSIGETLVQLLLEIDLHNRNLRCPQDKQQRTAVASVMHWYHGSQENLRAILQSKTTLTS